MGIALGKLFDIVPGVLPLDLQEARTGDMVNVRGCNHVTIVIVKGVGTDGDDQTFTLRQATTVGGTAKDLAIIDEYWEKEAATDLTGTGTWTRVTQTAAATIAPGDPSAQDAAVYVIEVDVEEMDIAGGFDCLQLNNDGAGANAQLGCIIYILSGLRYPNAPQNQINSIVDP